MDSKTANKAEMRAEEVSPVERWLKDGNPINIRLWYSKSAKGKIGARCYDRGNEFNVYADTVPDVLSAVAEGLDQAITYALKAGRPD